MARTLDVADRVVLLLSLIPYLREHGPTPVSTLAETFRTDAATIRKLVTFLGTAGIPGETHTYQPEDLFDIDWDAFEHDDSVSLTQIVAVDDTPRFSTAEYAALLAGLHTLESLLPPEQQALAASTAAKLAQAAPVAEETSVTTPVPISVASEPIDPQFSVIAAAIEQQHRLAFTYQDLRGVSSIRRIEPFSLAQSGHDWYLRGYCLDRESNRTFLVASMRDIRDTGDPITRISEGVVSTLGPTTAAIPALVHVRASAVHEISGFAPTVIEEVSPGWLLVEVLLEHPAAAIRLVQSAPADVRIQAPTTARDAVSEWARRALAPYDL